MRSLDRNCFVYVIATMRGSVPVSPVKVGISTDPSRRLEGLATACPNPIALLRTFRFPTRARASKIEREFHFLYNDQRMQREWFDIAPDEAVEGVETAIETEWVFFGLGAGDHDFRDSLWEYVRLPPGEEGACRSSC